MRNLLRFFGLCGSVLASFLVLPFTVSASSSYVYTNSSSLYDWVDQSSPPFAGLNPEPRVFWIPIDVGHPSPVGYQVTSRTNVSYSLLLYIFDASFPSQSTEIPNIGNGRYNFIFEIGTPEEWDYLQNPNWRAWSDMYGTFNAFIEDSDFLHWVGSYPPLFTTNHVNPLSPNSSSGGYGYQYLYSLTNQSPYWDYRRIRHYVVATLPRWTLLPVCMCWRNNYQSGDDWVWATGDAVFDYFSDYEPDVELPSYMNDLPYRLYDVCVWWPSNNIRLSFSHKVNMTNQWGVYTNDSFGGFAW